MNIFYCPTAILNEFTTLDETESHHLINVLRKKDKEELYVFDGNGSLFTATIEGIGKKEVVVRIKKLVDEEATGKPKLHIAIAPPKNIERMEWFAEKVTEIGVSEITPIITKHSERKELRADRIEKLLLGASKQSIKLTIPTLNPLIKFEDFLKSVKNVKGKYIAYCDEKSVHLKNACEAGTDAIILIGPEGDFTRDEVKLAEKSGFKTVSLGKSRLRLETAGIYAATVFNMANEK